VISGDVAFPLPDRLSGARSESLVRTKRSFIGVTATGVMGVRSLAGAGRERQPDRDNSLTNIDRLVITVRPAQPATSLRMGGEPKARSRLGSPNEMILLTPLAVTVSTTTPYAS
jgi:hypothetical protein